MYCFLLLKISHLDITFILSLSEWVANIILCVCVHEKVLDSLEWVSMNHKVGVGTEGLGSSVKRTSPSKS